MTLPPLLYCFIIIIKLDELLRYSKMTSCKISQILVFPPPTLLLHCHSVSQNLDTSSLCCNTILVFPLKDNEKEEAVIRCSLLCISENNLSLRKRFGGRSLPEQKTNEKLFSGMMFQEKNFSFRNIADLWFCKIYSFSESSCLWSSNAEYYIFIIATAK